jgi:hypothetical protein
MKRQDTPMRDLGRQMNLMFEPRKLDGLSKAEREEIIIILAQILMQAAGLGVEELDDDQH